MKHSSLADIEAAQHALDVAIGVYNLPFNYVTLLRYALGRLVCCEDLPVDPLSVAVRMADEDPGNPRTPSISDITRSISA